MAEPGPGIRVTRSGDPEWGALENAVDAARLPFPLPSRAAWTRAHLGDALLISAHDRSGAVIGALALEAKRARTMPGHRLLRALRAGAALAGDAGEALVHGIRELAVHESRILRVNIEVVLRTPEEHALVAARMRAVGFRETERMRHYRDTLVISLAGSEADLLASFSATTRRDLRSWVERSVEMRPITDDRYHKQLNALARETFERTGGTFAPRPWDARIKLCRELPHASRLVGLFRAGREDPDALLAFAWGCAHGDHAHYHDAGSTRTDDLKVSMMYPLMWDLIRWARLQGCAWFDMGGAVSVDARDDRRVGISDFKRRFSKEMVSVGAEWEFEPRPARSAVARWLGAAAARVRGG